MTEEVQTYLKQKLIEIYGGELSDSEISIEEFRAASHLDSVLQACASQRADAIRFEKMRAEQLLQYIETNGAAASIPATVASLTDFVQQCNAILEEAWA